MSFQSLQASDLIRLPPHERTAYINKLNQLNKQTKEKIQKKQNKKEEEIEMIKIEILSLYPQILNIFTLGTHTDIIKNELILEQPGNASSGKGSSVGERDVITKVTQEIVQREVETFKDVPYVIQGLCQGGKSMFIIGLAIMGFLHHGKALVILRNSECDKKQLSDRITRFIDELFL